MSVSLSIERGPHAGIARAEIQRRIVAMVKLLQLQKMELSILLTDDARIHELNKVYRHKDRPTDVLAFAMREGELGELAGDVLGDVIVSIPTARRQAEERSVALIDEVTMLLAHGLLHLLGWDHDTAAKDRRMRAETDRLCAAAAPPAPRKAVRTKARSASRTPSKPAAKKALSRKPNAARARGTTRKA